MDSTQYILKSLRQDITQNHLQLKALIQDINACVGPISELHSLNSAGRAKISSLRKFIDNFGDIAKENKDTELLKEVVCQREQLKKSMDDFKKANIKSMLTIEKNMKEELMKNVNEETNLRQRQKRDKENLVKRIQPREVPKRWTPW
ncbi:hypothetical protein QE152_g35136 [Popillia japonica]|uniref:Uncharacterized protein n=1 Tax=Popillia japonica TaxID=7064 RepID=A0AAW1ISL0_POPJA